MLHNEKDLYDLLLTEYHLGDQIKKNAMGRACGTYRRLERGVHSFGWEARGKETTWKT